MDERNATAPAPSAGERPREETGALARLAERLRALPERARVEGWREWTDADRHMVEFAARELAELERSLREGMRAAFEIGRQYGKREDVLEQLNREVAEASHRLGRAAWGAEETTRGAPPAG